MSRILFIEDQYENIKILVNWINRAYYENMLKIDVMMKTDDSTDFGKIASSYDAFFIDIELANKSKDDGVSVIKKLIEADGNTFSKIAIISGHSELSELVEKEKLPSKFVIDKPIEKDNLLSVFKKMGI